MTKIYTASTSINTIDTSIIEEYKSKSKKETLFYSDEGIFSMYKGELVKHTINDKKIIPHHYDNIKVVVDNSSTQKKRAFFQLPLGYVVQRTEVIDYKLCNNSEVKLVIVLENSIPIDIYFQTKQDYTHPEVENTVTTFLSLLNFY